MASNQPLALSQFIIAAIEEACPEIDGQAVYMRGFARFTDYCADQQRAAQGLPERQRRRQLTPEGKRALQRKAGLPDKQQMRRLRPRG